MTLQAIAAVLQEVSDNPSPARLQQLKEPLRQAARTLSADPTVSPREAAELLGVASPNTIKNWLGKKGFARTHTTPGGHVRLYLADVLAAKAEREAVAERRRKKTLDVPVSRAPNSDDFN